MIAFFGSRLGGKGPHGWLRNVECSKCMNGLGQLLHDGLVIVLYLWQIQQRDGRDWSLRLQYGLGGESD